MPSCRRDPSAPSRSCSRRWARSAIFCGVVTGWRFLILPRATLTSAAWERSVEEHWGSAAAADNLPPRAPLDHRAPTVPRPPQAGRLRVPAPVLRLKLIKKNNDGPLRNRQSHLLVLATSCWTGYSEKRECISCTA